MSVYPDPAVIHQWPSPYETGHRPEADCPCGPRRSEQHTPWGTNIKHTHQRLRPPSEALGPED